MAIVRRKRCWPLLHCVPFVARPKFCVSANSSSQSGDQWLASWLAAGSVPRAPRGGSYRSCECYSRALTLGGLAPESLLHKYLLDARGREGVGPQCWPWCPPGPLSCFWHSQREGLFCCQPAPPWPHTELLLTPAASWDALSTARKAVPQGPGLGPWPCGLLLAALGGGGLLAQPPRQAAGSCSLPSEWGAS